MDRFDAAHPIPTQLMYALDADTGKARWLSEESTPQDWTSSYVDVPGVGVATSSPALGGDEVWRRPGRRRRPCCRRRMEVLSDMTGADGARTLRLRLKPQRIRSGWSPLHVDASSTAVQRGGGRGAAGLRGRRGRRGRPWAFGIVFHAPPPEGIEVELVLHPGRRWHRPGAGAG